ncbi:YbjN domain-containing protein [Sphingomonas sp. LT1P40]|uniref:YbjN domain-containing protein n=1 Tax=Alteristakelama amylovorans TaxID=3096166 RepID=UPI002FCABB7E
MKLQASLTTLAVMTCMAVAAPADAQTLMVRDPQLIAELLRAEGYQANVEPVKAEESPFIRSGAGGAKFDLLFNDCTKGKDCQSVQFYAGFTGTKMTAEKINAWNSKKRFVRAYLDKEGDPILEMDVNIEPEGIPRPLFVDYLDIWSRLLGQFRTEVYAD